MTFVPDRPDGGLFLSTLQQQQRQLHTTPLAEAAVETTESGEVIVRQGDITVHDVLLGRGRGPNMHAGNQRYRQLIYANRDNYNKACNRTEQTRITREIVNHIKHNGRFLKRLETPKGGTKKKKKRGEANSDAWVLVDDATARLKVGQCLRYKLRRDAEQSEDGSLDDVQVEVRSSHYEGVKYSGGAILPTLETSANFVVPDSSEPAVATQPSRKYRKVALPQEPALDAEELKVLQAINRSGLVPDEDNKDLDGFVESPLWEAKPDMHILPEDSEEDYPNTVVGGYLDSMFGTGDSYDSNLTFGSDLMSDAEVLSALGYPQLPTQPTETRPTVLCYCGCRVDASEAHNHKHRSVPKNGIFSMPGAAPMGHAGTLRNRNDAVMTDSYDNMICPVITSNQDESRSMSSMSSTNVDFPIMTSSNNNNNNMMSHMWDPTMDPSPIQATLFQHHLMTQMLPMQSAPPDRLGGDAMFQVPNSAPAVRPRLW